MKNLFMAAAVIFGLALPVRAAYIVGPYISTTTGQAFETFAGVFSLAASSATSGTSTIKLNGNGSSYFNSGNVGIGTLNPVTSIEVAGVGSYGAIALSTSATSDNKYKAGIGIASNISTIISNAVINDLVLYASVAGGVSIGANGGTSANIHIMPSGNVGINTLTPPYSFSVVKSQAGNLVASIQNTNNTAGDDGLLVGVGPNSSDSSSYLISFYDSGINTMQGSIKRNGSNAVSFNTSSDRRIKDNIVPTHLGIADLMNLNVVDFTFKSDASNHLTNGLIAQDTLPIYPDAVSTNGDDGVVALSTAPNAGTWSIDYGRITPLIIKSVQDQQNFFTALAARVSALEAKVGP